MSEDWTRLGRLVRERREELDVSQGAGGVSISTWRKVEKAIDPPYQRAKLLAIFRTLGWAPESIERILASGDPVLASSGGEPGSGVTPREAVDMVFGTALTDRLDRMEAMVREIRDQLARYEAQQAQPERPEITPINDAPQRDEDNSEQH